MKRFFTITLLCLLTHCIWAQSYNQLNDDGTFRSADNEFGIAGRNDSVFKKNKKQEIPRNLKVWTVDERFGDITPAEPDTMHHMFMNSVLNGGLRGEYSSAGNIGTPRLNRIFIDRRHEEFVFAENYDMFIVPVENFHFTNTLSPITNISFNTCGSNDNGEDHFKALFAANAGKRFGFGIKFDYIYGKGYYDDSNTSHFGTTLWGSYLGDRYQAHLLFNTNHQKIAENGGVVNDDYITHPESKTTQYREKEIPVMLDQNWNRHDNHHIFFTHRYNVGFHRKVPMTEDEIKAKKFALESAKENAEKKRKERGEEPVQTFSGRPDDAKVAGDEPANIAGTAQERVKVGSKEVADSIMKANRKAQEDTMWMKEEYVPVTSFIHTAKVDLYRRIYEAYEIPTLDGKLKYYKNNKFYDNQVLSGDSIYDKTRYYSVKNTFAIALLEGFNKYAKAGLKVFASHEIKGYRLPDHQGGFERYSENYFFVGGQISKTQGRTLHYNATFEADVAGPDVGCFSLDGNIDVNFPVFGDTVTLAAKGFIHRVSPSFYFSDYHSKYLWWDDLDRKPEVRNHVEGLFSYQKTRTTLRVAFDNISNYTYFSRSYSSDPEYGRYNVIVKPNQQSGTVSVMTLQLTQDFTLGILNWENMVTYQKSSNQNILPLPDLNVYTNLYLNFNIAKVLRVHLGSDMRYFTSYQAPDYSPLMNTFAVQDNGANNIKVGNFPEINVYANLFLKHARFFVMVSHINESWGKKNYFQIPHYPLNKTLFRFGVSWNFFN